MASTEVISRTLRLNNGLIMPVLGLGTYKIKEPSPIVNAIMNHNYRYIDTASVYKNENILGEAFNQVNISFNSIGFQL